MARVDLGVRIQRNSAINPATGCWEWTGQLDRDGYSRIKVERRPRAAHRVSYEQHHGPIPDGLHVDHLCRVRHCVNPDHMELVTNEENIRRGYEARETGRCRNGHARTDGNTWTDAQGRRHCRTCRAAASRRYRDRAD